MKTSIHAYKKRVLIGKFIKFFKCFPFEILIEEVFFLFDSKRNGFSNPLWLKKVSVKAFESYRIF